MRSNTSIRFYSLVMIAALVTSVSAAAAQQGAKIAPRDRLTITVYGEPSISGPFTVGPDGTFQFPQIGVVKAGGLGTKEVETELVKLLSEYYVNVQVNVELEQNATKKVSVTGEVRSPSEYPFGGEITLLLALTRAGGTTDAAAEEALVVRAGSASTATPLRVDLHELMTGNMTNNLTLHDGDMVIVPKGELVYVSGQVRTQGGFIFRHDMTVQQVITLAGGVSEKGKTSGIKIQRTVNGKKTEIKDVKLTDLIKPGDTIIVPARIL